MIALQGACLMKRLLVHMRLAHCFTLWFECCWFFLLKKPLIHGLCSYEEIQARSPLLRKSSHQGSPLAFSPSSVSHRHGLNDLVLCSHSMFPRCRAWWVNICWTIQVTNPILTSFKMMQLKQSYFQLLYQKGIALHGNKLWLCCSSILSFPWSLMCYAHLIVVSILLRSKGTNGNKNNFVPAFHEQCLLRKTEAWTDQGKQANQQVWPAGRAGNTGS